MLPFLRPFETSKARKTREEAEFAKSEAIRKDSEDRLAAEQSREAPGSKPNSTPDRSDRLALFAEVKADKLAVAPQMATANHHRPGSQQLLPSRCQDQTQERLATVTAVTRGPSEMNPATTQPETCTLRHKPGRPVKSPPYKNCSLDYLNLKAILNTAAAARASPRNNRGTIPVDTGDRPFIKNFRREKSCT